MSEEEDKSIETPTIVQKAVETKKEIVSGEIPSTAQLMAAIKTNPFEAKFAEANRRMSYDLSSGGSSTEEGGKTQDGVGADGNGVGGLSGGGGGNGGGVGSRMSQLKHKLVRKNSAAQAGLSLKLPPPTLTTGSPGIFSNASILEDPGDAAGAMGTPEIARLVKQVSWVRGDSMTKVPGTAEVLDAVLNIGAEKQENSKDGPGNSDDLGKSLMPLLLQSMLQSYSVPPNNPNDALYLDSNILEHPSRPNFVQKTSISDTYNQLLTNSGNSPLISASHNQLLTNSLIQSMANSSSHSPLAHLLPGGAGAGLLYPPGGPAAALSPHTLSQQTLSSSSSSSPNLKALSSPSIIHSIFSSRVAGGSSPPSINPLQSTTTTTTTSTSSSSLLTPTTLPLGGSDPFNNVNVDDPPSLTNNPTTAGPLDTAAADGMFLQLRVANQIIKVPFDVAAVGAAAAAGLSPQPHQQLSQPSLIPSSSSSSSLLLQPSSSSSSSLLPIPPAASKSTAAATIGSIPSVPAITTSTLCQPLVTSLNPMTSWSDAAGLTSLGAQSIGGPNLLNIPTSLSPTHSISPSGSMDASSLMKHSRKEAASPMDPMSLTDMDDPESKRKDTLERNKAAAIRYRKRKKEELNGLQDKVRKTEEEKFELQTQVTVLKRELERVTKKLDIHRACGCTCEAKVKGGDLEGSYIIQPLVIPGNSGGAAGGSTGGGGNPSTIAANNIQLPYFLQLPSKTSTTS